jgi:Golgi phosphoprotein 3 (GPP34)
MTVVWLRQITQNCKFAEMLLSHMSRGLDQRLGVGTWDAVIGGLVDAGVVTPVEGGLRARYTIVDVAARVAIVERLRAAASGDQLLDARTAMLLSMTGPAQLLEVVAPDRGNRKHARRRIDNALDSTALESVGESVRRVLAEAAAAVAVAASVAVVATSG